MARKFRYRLEPLLRKRRDEEEQQLQRVARAAEAVRKTEKEICDCSDSLDEAKVRAGQRLREGVPMIEFLQANARYQVAMLSVVAKMQHRLVTEKESLEVEQRLMAERRIARKTLERHRERQKSAHDLVMRKEEAAELDEIGQRLASCRRKGQPS